MKVLSLFDGMACGMIAMQLAGMEVESYDAYEIDKYAIKTAQHNFPMIKGHGDVFSADFTQYEGVDFLIGGSPCTYWSIAQTKNRETVASGMGWELFSQYVRALHEAKPKYFIYENNKSMSKQIRASIDKAFGFEAVLINSALVSAQNRQRLYWVGKRNEDGTYSKVPVEQPEDRGILLRDILETGIAWHEKSYCITATEYKGSNPKQTLTKHRRTMAAEPIDPRCVAQRGRYPENPKSRVAGLPTEQMFEARQDGKTNTLTTVQKDNLVAEPVRIGTIENDAKNPTHDSRQYRVYSPDGKGVTLCGGYGGLGTRTGLYATPVRVGDMPSADGKICGSQSKRIYSIDGKAPSICATETGGNSDTSSPATRLYAEPVGIKHLGSLYGQHSRWGVFDEEGKAPTLTASAGMGGGHLPMVKEPVKVGYIGNGGQGNRIYSVNGKAVAQTAQSGGMGSNTGLYAIPTMPVKEATSRGYTEIECGECVDLSMPNSKTRRGISMADKSNCMQTSNDFYQYVGYAIEFDDEGKPIKAIGKDGKEITIYEVRNGLITIKGKQYPIKLRDGYYIIRKLTVRECMRLQTVPEWYEFPVSDSQAYKMLGNGWTCEVIAHLIRSAMAKHIQIE